MSVLIVLGLGRKRRAMSELIVLGLGRREL